MKLNLKELIWFTLYCLLCLIGFVGAGSQLNLLLCLALYFTTGIFVNNNSSVHMIFFLSYTTFIFLPAVLNWFYLDINFSLFFISSFISIVFLITTKKTTTKKFIDFGSKIRKTYFLAITVSIALFLSGINYANPIFPILIFLMALSFKDGDIKNNILVFLTFNIPYVLYILFVWNGFGRLVSFGWFILALFIYTQSMNFKLNKYYFSLIPGLSSTLLGNRNLLHLNFVSLENSLYDSAFGPYRKASEFINEFYARGYDVSGFLDQIIFTIGVFIPRSIWTNKPYGFGYEYTVRHLEQSLVDSGHSIASTLIGDQIYFLGYLGLICSIIIYVMIAKFTLFMYKIKNLNGNGVLIISSSIMALPWGGITSFSARIITSIIVFFLILPFIKNLTKARDIKQFKHHYFHNKTAN